MVERVSELSFRGNSNAQAIEANKKMLADTTAMPPSNGSPKQSFPLENSTAIGAANSIRIATKRDNFIDTGTDEKRIFSVLNSLNDQDRKDLKAVYKNRYKIDLEAELKREMSGSDLDRALNLLNRTDSKSDDAGFVHETLLENKETFGRSRTALAKALRDKLCSMSSSDIATADADYRNRYAVGLKTALQRGGFSQATNDALDVYFKGTDKRTADDTLKLADIALKSKDIEMFQEAMRGISPEVSDRFMKEGGEARMKRAFEGHWYNLALYAVPLVPKGNISDTELSHARDLAKHGQFSAATLVRDNTTLLGDNEVAIETAFSQMTDQERAGYLIGKKMTHGEQVDGLDAKEKAYAADTYRKLHQAIYKAGNKCEQLMWEDQIEFKGGSLVTKLGRHNGLIKDAPMDTVMTTIESMSEREWHRLKEDPSCRKNVSDVLSTYLSTGELKRATDLIQQKVGANSFEESKQSARRSVFDTINDNKHRGFLWLNTKEDDVYKAIENMTPQEQEKYRTDRAFQTRLDNVIRSTLDVGAEREVAFSLLQKIKENKVPIQSIFEKLAVYSTHFSVDEAKVIREVEKAFRDDPALFDRIKNPRTPEEVNDSMRMRRLLRSAIGSGDFEIYGEPLLKNGFIPLEQHISLNKSIFGIDEKGVMETMKSLPESQRQLLLNDRTTNGARLRAITFGSLTTDEKTLATVLADQHEAKPEDKLRAYILGVGGDDGEIMAMLQSMDAPSKLAMSKAYSEKYKSNATSDFLDQLRKKDRPKGELTIEFMEKTLGQQISDGINMHSRSRDGLGKAFVDSVWDGTGFQFDNALNQMIVGMSASGDKPNPAKLMELRQNLITTHDNFRDSKNKAGEVATDVTIAVAAVAGAYFTGGLSLSLLAKASIAGAIGAGIKLGGKALVNGDDQDWSARQVASDGGRGFAAGFLSFVGASQFANAIGVGNVPGTEASKVALAQIASQGNGLLQEGAGEVIEQSFQQIMRQAIMTNSMRVPVESMKVLAAHVATTGGEQTVEAALTSALSQALQQQSSRVAMNLLTEYGLTAASGSFGGGTGGFIGGVSEWDGRKPFDENLARVGKSVGTGAAVGAISGIVHKTAYKAIGFGAHRVTGFLEDPAETDIFLDDNLDKIGKFRIKPILPRLAAPSETPSTTPLRNNITQSAVNILRSSRQAAQEIEDGR